MSAAPAAPHTLRDTVGSMIITTHQIGPGDTFDTVVSFTGLQRTIHKECHGWAAAQEQHAHTVEIARQNHLAAHSG